MVIQYSDELEKFKIVPLGREPGLIIPMKTGVKFTNQVNGVCCSHPELEGIFIPLSAYTDDDLTDIWQEYPTIEFIEDWIFRHRLPLKVLSRKWYKGFGRGGHYPEAWINVKILKTNDSSPFKDFIGMEAILTYENSD